MPEMEHPQKSYVKKKIIFRFYQIVWYVLGLIETVLSFRIILKALGANTSSMFTQWVYRASDPLILPFRGVVRTITEGSSVFELSTFIACLVYVVVAIALIEIVQIVKPTNPEEVEQNT